VYCDKSVWEISRVLYRSSPKIGERCNKWTGDVAQPVISSREYSAEDKYGAPQSDSPVSGQIWHWKIHVCKMYTKRKKRFREICPFMVGRNSKSPWSKF
jgi:hypothetical protein